ncbi:Tigger transposable element-derived protein 6 [Dictyocoela muelleri]|nr:Tigger transposable element-derived protein 6 [Dictyocoela muelleri]
MFFFESNKNNECVRMNRQPTKTQIFDQELYEWFRNKRARNFLISQENFKEMALNLASKYKIKNFKASDGYIQKFEERQKIKSRSVVGESGCVNLTYIEDLIDFYNSKLEEYQPRDIFNADETGLFWRINSNRSLVLKEEDKASGKIFKRKIGFIILCEYGRRENESCCCWKIKKPIFF